MRARPLPLLLWVVIGSLAARPVRAEKEGEGALARAMKDELARSLKLRLPGAERPFFVSYLIEDVDYESLTAEYGGLVEHRSHRRRQLRVDVRVGSKSFSASSTMRVEPRLITTDDDYFALRRQLWLATDEAYKAAADDLEKKRAGLSSRAESDKEVPEMSEEKPHREIVGDEAEAPSLGGYEPLVRDLSALLSGYPDLQEGYVELSATRSRRTFASTEKTFTAEPGSLVELQVVARTQADDGMPLQDQVSVLVPGLADLPAREKLLARVRAMCERLSAMRAAPVIEDYGGPILFEGEAAGQILAHLLAPNLSGTPPVRDPRFEEMPGFEDTKLARKVDKRVMPQSFRVEDDPTRARAAGAPLLGHYRVDDEGTEAQKVLLVEGGRLRGFLMSRAPREGFLHSTGHGRGSGFGPPKAHVSNLFVRARGVSRGGLERELVKEARAGGEDYGLVVTRLAVPEVSTDLGPELAKALGREQGDSGAPLLALVAYRVTRPGRRELVRGITIDPMRVRALKDILAAGRRGAVYSYVDEQGVPASIVTPPLLFEDAEVQKLHGPYPKPPVLRSPLER